MARAELSVGELLLKLVSKETGEISKVDYYPQKPEFEQGTVFLEQALERSSPESQGVSSAFFTDLIRSLSRDKDCNMHKFMALRHGKVIAECAFEPYDLNYWHVSYSMCKSIVGMAIGILIYEEKLTLDTKLSEIFSSGGILSFLKKDITVRHLLTMSSGSDFNEAGIVSGNDWKKSFLESGSKFEPGTKFDYNSMNTYMLSAIVTEVTGETLFEYCRERIFEPMGIKRIFWESCPKHITKGGWGLFIRAEDMAKLGQLYLQKGQWKGKQIVPEDWVKESTSWQIETSNDTDEHYGYQIWVNDDRKGSFAYNGILGQNVFVYPDVDMVVVTNAGNSDIFETSKMAMKIRNAMKNDLVVSDEPLPEDFKALNELKAICKSVSGRTAAFPTISGGGWKRRCVKMTTGRPRPSSVNVDVNKRSTFKDYVNAYNVRNENQLRAMWLDKLDGTKYKMDVSGVGVFPLMMQIVHNNFTDGISKIGFRKGDNNSFFIELYEGDQIYSLRCGFGGKRYISMINMHGEKYRVTVSSFCQTDEYNRFVIRNDICFMEEACGRSINIYFENDALDREDGKATFIHPAVPKAIEVRFLENPGADMLMNTINGLSPESLGSIESKLIEKFYKGGLKYVIENAMVDMVQPIIHGTIVIGDGTMVQSEDEISLEDRNE
ncbi:serine hydrolase domain-containing protein [Butyrivibrio proteoclasticus]|uniref:serine hydrolase domain-containing protein n=1 Tax=Butyrivibrio proteoclasticus TaxID=43305 RepID=UPI000684D4FC|nr:serine hydrolase [Butyrivibrio proteoclasticus]